MVSAKILRHRYDISPGEVIVSENYQRVAEIEKREVSVSWILGE